MGSATTRFYVVRNIDGSSDIKNAKDIHNKTARNTNSYMYFTKSGEGTHNAAIRYYTDAITYDFPVNSVNRRISSYQWYADGGFMSRYHINGASSVYFRTGDNGNTAETTQYGTISKTVGGLFDQGDKTSFDLNMTACRGPAPTLDQEATIVFLLQIKNPALTGNDRRAIVTTCYLDVTFAWDDDPGESLHYINGTKVQPDKLYTNGQQALKRYVSGVGVYRLAGQIF